MIRSNPRRRLVSSASLGKGNWVMKRYIKSSDIAFQKKESDHRSLASKLKVLSVANSHFRRVGNYTNYRMVDKFHTYNRKITAKTGEYMKNMERLMKANKFDDKDLIMILRFLILFSGRATPMKS